MIVDNWGMKVLDWAKLCATWLIWMCFENTECWQCLHYLYWKWTKQMSWKSELLKIWRFSSWKKLTKIIIENLSIFETFWIFITQQFNTYVYFCFNSHSLNVCVFQIFNLNFTFFVSHQHCRKEKSSKTYQSF